ncbi:MAG: flagellar protein FliS [Eubacteriales bacterium]|nr:flagellar protein FliS [Eubacteriales bacterium]
MSFSKKDYVAKISNASPLQLIIINFEIIIDYINESKQYIGTKNKNFDFNVKKSRQFLSELRYSLNMEYEISANLMSLYNFIDSQLAHYLFNEKIEIANHCINILNNILEGFKDIENKEEDKSSLMENTQQIFAGLTYDKKGNLEEFIDTDTNRGFKA